jgi:L-ribulose-5-phosphate 3-epimerase
MIEKNKFVKNLAITQGRHLKIIKKKIQLFPDKNWKKELKLFNYTKIKFIEWVVSKENFNKNPICKIHGFKIIKKYLNKNFIKCRSVDLDFIIKENPLEFSKKKLESFINKIKIISSNSSKVGIKYLILPFLDNSTPNNKHKIKKLTELLIKIKKKISKKIFILIETDINPKKLLEVIKTINNIYINYDLGNSASKNYNLNEEKKYFKYVKNIHLKDRIKNGSTVRFGKGNADFKIFFNFLNKTKNKYTFTLQPARSNCNQDIKEIKLNIEYLKNILSIL